MDMLRDIVVVIPGITGSVLKKDEQEVWSPTVGALVRAATSRGEALRALEIKGPDSGGDAFGDGVVATRLMPDAHILPGIGKILDGYTGLRKLVKNTYAVEVGDQNHIGPANYFEFAYDWRRNNTFPAQALKRLVDKALPLWRDHRGATDAKVIILAHSMGGLVARHWLEVLEGWRDCRALITFGTPYRGSPKAAGTLINGYKALFDLTQAMRSFPSIYQLLPTYPIIARANDTWARIAECDLPFIDPSRAKDALCFHRKIESAVEAHQRDAAYLTPKTSYRILPVVGVSQPTFQSLALVNGALTLSYKSPGAKAASFPAGDGTVPRLSATPLELSDYYAETFIADLHGSLQANATILDNVQHQLIQMQARGHGDINGPAEDPVRARGAGLALTIDDAYMPGEPVRLRAELRVMGSNALLPADVAAGEPMAHIAPIDRPGGVEHRTFQRDLDGWRLDADDLPAGSYRLEVDLPDGLKTGVLVSPIRDLFEIMAPSDV